MIKLFYVLSCNKPIDSSEISVNFQLEIPAGHPLVPTGRVVLLMMGHTSVIVYKDGRVKLVATVSTTLDYHILPL